MDNTWFKEILEAKKQKKLAKSTVKIEEVSDEDVEWIEPKVSARELLLEHEEASGYTFTSSSSGMVRSSQAPGPLAPPPKAPGITPVAPKAPGIGAAVLEAPVAPQAPGIGAAVLEAPEPQALGSVPAAPLAHEPQTPVEANIEAPVEHKAPEFPMAVAPKSKASVMKRPAMEEIAGPRKRYCRKGP